MRFMSNFYYLLWFQKQLKGVEVETRHHESRHARNTKILDQVKSGKVKGNIHLLSH